jgi:hypothetical protein
MICPGIVFEDCPSSHGGQCNCAERGGGTPHKFEDYAIWNDDGTTIRACVRCGLKAGANGQ